VGLTPNGNWLTSPVAAETNEKELRRLMGI